MVIVVLNELKTTLLLSAYFKGSETQFWQYFSETANAFIYSISRDRMDRMLLLRRDQIRREFCNPMEELYLFLRLGLFAPFINFAFLCTIL